MALDAQTGLRAEGTGELEDVVLVKRGEREPAARVPKLAIQLADFAYQDDEVQVGRFELGARRAFKRPAGRAEASYQVSTLRASIADAHMAGHRPGPARSAGGIPGGGTLALTGRSGPPPASSQLRLRLARVDLAPWAQFLPVAAPVDGFAEADLRVDEPIALGRPAAGTRLHRRESRSG